LPTTGGTALQSKQLAWRRFGTLLGPACDAVAFCVLLGAGASLRASLWMAFAIGLAVTWARQIPALRAAAKEISVARLGLRLAAVGLMAGLLRGGLLALLVERAHWLPQLAILLVVAAGVAVVLPGSSYALSTAADDSRRRSFALGLIAYAFALRLVFAGSVDMLPEETYYWSYARHLDFGYLDHPPMVAWLIGAGTWIFGQNEFGVRIGALLCGLIASLYIYKLSRDLFGEAAALAAVLLASMLPFFFLSGLLLTPDSPMTAAWAAALYYLQRALIADDAGAWWRAGIALGLGMFSKYSIALLGLVTVAFMLWDASSRRWFRRPQPYIAAAIAAAIFSPVIIWNAQHDWASFVFQTSRRLAEPPQFALHKLLGSMLVLITPTGLLAIVLTRRGGASLRQARFIGLALLIPLSVFALFSLRHEVKLDWTGATWCAAVPALACSVLGLANVNMPWRRRLLAAWPPTLIALALLYGGLLHYLVMGLPGVAYSKHIETTPVGWRDLSSRMLDCASQERKLSGKDPLIVGMDRYAIASEIAFYGTRQSGARVETSSSVLFDGVGLMYQRWTPPSSQTGRDLLLVAWDPGELSDALLEPRVERLGPIEREVLQRDGRFVRHYYHRMAYNYRYGAREK
jgi:dolichol-phosphate mannosyltransferase